jgi:hypothetical protein
VSRPAPGRASAGDLPDGVAGAPPWAQRQIISRRQLLSGMAIGAVSVALGSCSNGGDTSSSGGDASTGTTRGRREPARFDAGDVAHILPSVTHERMLLKVSFATSRPESPMLRVGDQTVTGIATDIDRTFFTFDVDGLEPGTTFDLQLVEADDTEITSSWPLATFPAPDDGAAERLRLLCISCPGGAEEFVAPIPQPDTPQFQSMAVRRRILARGRTFEPDAMLVNGDHIYWDSARSVPSGQFQGASEIAERILGDTPFDRGRPVEGDAGNEAAVKKAFGPQIAGLYGVEFRSIPTYFTQDDHDYGDNDEARADGTTTFPPDHFARDLARFTQKLYYPELFAPDDVDPLPGDLGDGLATSFGMFRYGRLAEGWVYDCKGHWSDYALRPDGTEPDGSADDDAKFLPAAVEAWLLDRTSGSDAVHTFHSPSTPILWTAGKWAEPYPDVLDADGQLTVDEPKRFWPPGWGRQQDRILDAVSERRDRVPLFLQGDIHATGLGTINASNDRDYSENPIVAVLVGTPGSNLPGFPSTFRGVEVQPSLTIDADLDLPALEQNGFTLVDFTRSSISVRPFVWDVRTQDEAAIDRMEAVLEREYRPGSGS